MRGARLIKKEIRQVLGMMVFLCVLPAVLLGVQWFFAYLPDETPNKVNYFGLAYWIILSMAAALGSAFLADENGARTASFLLRQPISRRRIFGLKLLSHGVLFLAGVLVVAMTAWGFARYCRLLPPAPSDWNDARLYTGPLWILLIYFLGVCFSVVLDRAITAFLAAGATAAIVWAVTLWAGTGIAARYMRGQTDDFRTAQLIMNILLTCLLPAVAALSLWLFSRKEGR